MIEWWAVVVIAFAAVVFGVGVGLLLRDWQRIKGLLDEGGPW